MSPELLRALRDAETIQHPFFEIGRRAVLIRAGYAWDGATMAVNTGSLIVPSLIHDIGCQAVNLALLPFEFRACFDAEYYTQSLAYDVPKIRAAIHYVAVRFWGTFPKSEKAVAPYADVLDIKIRGVL